MGHDYSADLSGLRDELISGLRDLRKEIKQEGKKVSEAIEDIAKDIDVDPIEIAVDTKDAKKELKELDKKLTSFINKIKKNLGSLSTSDMREVLSIISQLKDVDRYAERIQNTFRNITASFIGIGEVTGLQEVVEEFKNSSSALRNVDWGFGKLHDKNQLIEDQKVIIDQLKQIGKLRVTSVRTRSGDFSEGKIDIFDGDFEVDELETRIALLESLRDNINNLAVLTKAKKITLFDDSIYHPENIVYAIGRAINSAQAQFPAIDEYDVPDPEDLFKQFEGHVGSVVDRKEMSKRLQDDFEFYKEAILNGRYTVEEAINSFNKDIAVDPMYDAWEKILEGVDIPDGLLSKPDELAYNIKTGAITLEEAIGEIQSIADRLQTEIVSDDFDDLDDLFESENLRYYNDLIAECTNLTGELSDAVAKHAKIQREMVSIWQSGNVVPEGLIEAREQIEQVISGYFKKDLSEPLLSSDGIIEWLQSYEAAAMSVADLVRDMDTKFEHAAQIEVEDARVRSQEIPTTPSVELSTSPKEEFKNIVQLVDNYGCKLDDVNNKLMQGTTLLNEQYQVLRLFHNSDAVFDQFDDSKISAENMMGRGHYLSTSQTDYINGYGKYQTQWYANIKKMFDYGDALSAEDAAKIISKYCIDAVETFSQKMLTDLTTDGEAFSALLTIGEAYEKDIADILSTAGYDSIQMGSAINVFDKNNLHRANNTVLETDTEEFKKLYRIRNELQAAKILAERHQSDQSAENIKHLEQEYNIQKQITDEILRRSIELKEPVEVPVTPVVESGTVQQDISTMVSGDIIDKITKGIDIEKMLSGRGLQGEQLTKGIDLFKDFAGSLYLGDDSPESSDDLFSELFDFVAQNAQRTEYVEKTLDAFREYMKGVQIKIPENLEGEWAAEFTDSWDELKKIYAIGGNSKNKKKLLTTSKYADTPTKIVEGLLAPDVNLGYALDSNMLRDWNGSDQDALRMLLDAIQRAKDEFKMPKMKTILGLSDKEQEDFSVMLVEATNRMSQNVAALHAPLVRASTDNDTLAESADRAAFALERETVSTEDTAAAMKKLQDVEQTQKDNKQPVDIIQKSVDEALAQLRRASDNKTALIDLTEVSSVGDLENQVRSMAQNIVGSDLKVDSVIVQDDIARITLYNEQLGVTASQMWRLKEATEDATQAQLEYISGTQKYSPRAAQKYSDAQQKKIENDNKWLIGQLSKLNTLERQYQYSGKKISGDTLLGDSDGTSLEKGATKTIDSLATHIKERIANSMDEVLTDDVKNTILNDLRILDNEIKIQQYKQYATTTMKPTELEEARKELEYTLDSLESKAKKNNVFSQMLGDFNLLRKRLTDESDEKYIKDATGVGEFVDSLRVTRSKLSAAILNEQEVKSNEQALKNLLNLQERLYESKKKYVALEMSESANSSDLQAAERKTDELQRQYDTSLSLLKTVEDYEAAKHRELALEKELRTVQDEAFEARQNKIKDAEAAEEAKIAKQTKIEIDLDDKAQLEIQNKQIANYNELIKLQKQYNEADYNWHKADISGDDKGPYNEQMDSYLQRMQKIREETVLTAEQEIELNKINHEHLLKKKKLLDDAAASEQKYNQQVADITSKVSSQMDAWDKDHSFNRIFSDELRNEINAFRDSLSNLDQDTNFTALNKEWDKIVEKTKKATKANDDYVASAWKNRFQNEYQYHSMPSSYDDGEYYTYTNGKTAQDQTVLDQMANHYRQEAEAAQDAFERAQKEAKEFDDNISSIYDRLIKTTKDMSSVDDKINKLTLKDGGTGLYSDSIKSLQEQKSYLVSDLRSINNEIKTALSLDSESVSSPIMVFFEDTRVQAVLTTEEIEKFQNVLKEMTDKSFGFKESLAAQIQPFVEKLQSLKQMLSGGLIDKDSVSALNILKADSLYSQKWGQFAQNPDTFNAADILKFVDANKEYIDSLEKAVSKESEYFANKKQYANISNMQDYDSIASGIDKISNSANNAKESLEKFVNGFTDGRAIITGFTTSANGISRIDFSVLEEGTGHLRNFSAEMGQFTNNIYTVETSMNSMTAGTKAAQSALATMSQVMSRLNSYGLNVDNSEYVSNLYKKMQALNEALASMGTSKDVGDQNTLQNMATDANRLIKTLKTLENAYLGVKDAVADGKADQVGVIGTDEDVYEKMVQFAKEIAATMPGCTISIGKFNEETKQLPYVIESADGEAKTFIMTMEDLGRTVTTKLKSVEQAKTGWQEFGDTLGGLGKEVLKYGATLVGVHDIVRYLKQGFNEVLEIDTAMTELKKVTEETDLAYSNFLESAHKSAQKIGSTMKDFTQATADFARLGYTLEEASMLAEAANVYMNVGDGIEDVGTASESIISTMKAFNIEAEDSMGIVDRFNEVGNNFAIDSVGIGEALQRSASALFEAGNTIDESIALVTGANTVIQNPEQVGTALKTLALRLRGAKVELEEAGLETENMAESTSTLQSKLQALTHGKVDIMEDAETFKSTTQILREMADVWEYMTDIERASALELMGGKRQANILSSLISNFDIVEDVIQTSLNSENSAIEENEKYLDSMQGRIDQLTNSMQAMWIHALDSEFLKFLIDVANAIVKVVDKVGLLDSAIGAFVGFQSMSNSIKKDFQAIDDGILSITDAFKTRTQATIQATAAENADTAAIKQNTQSAIENSTTAQQQVAADKQKEQASNSAAAAQRNENQAQIESEAAGEIEEAQDRENQNVDKETIRINNQVAASQSAENAAQMAGTISSTSKSSTGGALGDIIGGTIGTSAIKGAITKGASKLGALFLGGLKGILIGSLVTLGMDLLGKAFDSIGDAIGDAFKSIEEKAESASDAINKYTDAQESLQEQKETVDELAKSYAVLSNGVNTLNNDNINLSTSSYQEYLDICNKIADMYPHLVSGFDAQGNAILSLKGNIDELVQAYNDAAQASRQKIISSGDDIFDTFKSNYDNNAGIFNKTTGYTQQASLAQEFLDAINTGDKKVMQDLYDSYADHGRLSQDVKNMLNAAGVDYQDLTDFKLFRGEVVNVEEFEKAANKLTTLIQSTTTKINTETNKVKTLMDAYLGENLNYAKFDDKTRSAVDQIISGLSAEFINGFDDADALWNWIETNVVNAFADPKIGKSISDSISNAFNLQAQLKTGDLGLKSYQDEILAFVDTIKGSGLNEEVQKQILQMFDIDFDNAESIGSEIDQMLNHVQEIVNKDAKNKVLELSYSDLQIVNSDKFKVPSGTLLSWDELQEKIKETKIAMTEDFTTDDFTNYTESVNTIQSSISTYQEALEKLDSGTFTMSDFISLIEQFPDLAKGVNIASKSFDGLDGNLRRAIKASPKALIKDLKELKLQLQEAGKSTVYIDQLIDAVENMPEDAVEGLTEEYITLADKINAAKVAQNELNAAMEENPNEGFETRGSAIEQMKTIMEQGAIGSESELWDIAKAFGFTYDSAKSINENADALAKFIATREEWYKTDDDGNYTFDGTEEFLNDVEKVVASNEKLQEMGVKWSYDDKTGSLDFDFNNADWDEIVSVLGETKELAGLTSEEFYDLLMQVGQFFDIKWENNDDILSYLNAIAEGTDEPTEKLQKYAAAMEQAFGKNTNIDLTNRPVVNQTTMQGAGWSDFEDGYATVYSSAYSNQDESVTITATPILPDGKVLSPKQLEKYATEIAEGADPATYKFEVDGETYTGDDIVLARHEGEDSVQKAIEYGEALHEAQEQYQTLQDPLDLEITIAKDGLEGLNKIVDLQGSIQTNSDGITVINTDAFEDALEAAGYTEQQISNLIAKIKEYENVCEITINDPLGLNNTTASISTVASSLDYLGIKYTETKNELGEPVSININSTDLITTLQQSGWTREQIVAYLQTLTDETNGFGISIDGQVNMNAEQIDQAITKANQVPEEENVVLNVDDQQLTNVENRLNALDGKVVSSYVNTYETTYKETKTVPGNADSEANGTAHVLGTAYKSGSWGAVETETALVGELGPELLVRDGHWTTVGQNGAEFTQVKKGDIIFNHKQTEQLLKNGYVTGRGKAYAEGNAFASGSGTFNKYDFSGNGGYTKYDVNNKVVDKWGNTASSLSNAADKISDSAEDAADEFREVFDWIEVRLEEINEDLDLKNAKLDNTVGYKKQNAIVDDMIDLNEKLYENLIAGANKYYAYARTLLAKVPSAYRQAAQDGTIAIEEFVGEVDEKTLEAIKDYREWVQKGADATQQAEEVLTEISSLAKQAIDNIASDYDNKKSIRDNEIDQLDAYNALSETKYGSESSKIYKEIIKETNKNITTLEEQRNKMQAELNEQVKVGNIKKYSQDWYDAINDIAALDKEIIELTADTYDYQDAINEIRWDHFDNLIEQYEMVADEAENLIDILGTKDVVDDDGRWTDEGITSLGLYAQQMEVAEIQAKKYKEEINYLNKNWETMGLTQQEYIEKLDELKSGQYESIQLYNETKDAIVDLNKERVDAIKDGIEKEIEAYEELIEKKKEALDAEKDAYDFQKSVSEQNKEISDIERQIAALSADNSASARAKRAKLQAELYQAQADLEEIFYEKSISDQQEALDKELESFQKEKEQELDGWDEYLENTEQVVSDSLSTVQNNTGIVYETLKSMGQEYSLQIADALTSPWKNGEDAIQSYSEKFKLTMSSTVEELQSISDEYKAIMNGIESAGSDAVNQVNTNTQTYQEEKKQVDTTTTEDKKAAEKQVKVGGKINAGSAKIYEYAGATSGSQQYYSDDPIYKVLKIDGDWIQVRHHKQSTGIAGWFRKSQVKAYAKGTTGIKDDQLALIDELGEELAMHAGKNGKLEFMTKGSTVIPHDITENLMQLGELNPQDILDRNRPVISAPHITNNNIELNVSFGEVVHIEHVDNNAVPNLAKTVEKQIDKYMKGLNAEIRKYVR